MGCYAQAGRGLRYHLPPRGALGVAMRWAGSIRRPYSRYLAGFECPLHSTALRAAQLGFY